MFEKIAAIESVNLTAGTEGELHLYAEEVYMYHDIPGDNQKIIRRIGGGDGVLVNYTSKISAHVIENCPPIRYIGMCCNLYSEESANVDIAYARKNGIIALGAWDYGDRGVVGFAISELIRFPHGYNRPLFKDMPIEITDLKVGIMGISVSGRMIVNAMRFMGAGVSYYSRTRKAEGESQGMTHRPLKEPLEYSGVAFTCLNKNTTLLHEEKFRQLGTGRPLFNTSIGPASDIPAPGKWLDQKGNHFICDTEGALGDPVGELLKHPYMVYAYESAGRARQALDLLSKKVLDNLRVFLSAQIRLL